MVTSRIRRFEEKNALRRILVAVIGSVVLLVFIGVFGLKLLIGFSLLVDRIRGNSIPNQQLQQPVIEPPVLDPLPNATNSGTLILRGKGIPQNSVTVYLNDREYKKLPIPDTGVFYLSDIPVTEGAVTLSAKVMDDKNNISGLSNVITTTVDRTAPKLEISEPADNSSVNDGTHKVSVKGITEEDVKVTINGRIAVVKSDGSFIYAISLNDGDNKLTIESHDAAGNITAVTRNVKYIP